MEKVLPLLREGKPARMTEVTEEEKPIFKGLMLLTSKPVVYVCNVEEASAATGNSFSAKVAERAKAEGAASVVISAKIESEFAALAPEERDAFLADLGSRKPVSTSSSARATGCWT